MRIVRTFLTWLRTRKRASAALTFDALVERAMQKQQNASREDRRPGYLLSPGALSRIALAIGGGASLYAAIGAIAVGFQRGGRWSLLSLAAPVLGMIALRLAKLLGASLYRCNSVSVNDYKTEIVFLRVVCWPITEPLCVLFGWVCAYLYYAIDRIIARGKQADVSSSSAATHASSREDAIRRIPDLIVAIIAEERERLFGTSSPFTQLRTRIESQLEKARGLHAYFTKRAADAGNAERRSTAIERAAAVRDQLDGERQRLDEWRARVDAELGAYREHVQGLAPEIDELVHYRALSQLEESVATLAAEVEAMIAGMTTELLARVHGRCRDLSGALHDASAHVAVAAAQTGDADRDVRIITETVRDLVRRAPTYTAAAVREDLHRSKAPAVLG